ncbi:unnamed protein product [Ceratitis capitata]|uniref:(Mediterranean fruit fly) hypothetical protein n=1 Tax=Ceratitis capitata TaxID=7213 RepID=A0A811V0E9_CERCA|nr:unnamed protein product [Ceratitis capitata]
MLRRATNPINSSKALSATGNATGDGGNVSSSSTSLLTHSPYSNVIHHKQANKRGNNNDVHNEAAAAVDTDE